MGAHVSTKAVEILAPRTSLTPCILDDDAGQLEMLSGLVTEAKPDWQIADLRRAVDHIRACFGPRRLLWGSDWPVVNLAGGYAKWLAAAQSLLADLSPIEAGGVFGGNAVRIYLSNRGRPT